MLDGEHSGLEHGEIRRGIGLRLRGERERLALTQEQLAVHIGVTRLSVLNYEGGLRCPSADQLQQLHAIGVDIGFIVTGEARADVPRAREKFAAAYALVRKYCGVAGLSLGDVELLSASWYLYDQLSAPDAPNEPNPRHVARFMKAALAECVRG